MTLAPIMIDCEGSGCPTHGSMSNLRGVGMCMMCGQWFNLVDGVAEPHKRADVLAMIDRGDFE
jgi:hypothetical protein